MSSVVAGHVQARSTRLPGFGPELALLAVVFFWASSTVVTKATFVEINPLALTFVRFFLITLLGFAVLFVHGRPGERGLHRADLPRFILVGLTGYTIYQLGYVLGVERTSAFSTTLALAMVPLISVVILALTGERSGTRAWLGIGVALIGVAIFLSGKLDQPGSLLGDALSFGAAVSFAVYGIINRPLVDRYPAATYTAYSLLAGTIPLMIVTLPGVFDQNWAAITAAGWLAILYLVVFPVYVAYILWNWAISRRGVAAATSFGLLVPIVTGVLSAIVFSEEFGPIKVIGSGLVLAGLVIVRSRSGAAAVKQEESA